MLTFRPLTSPRVQKGSRVRSVSGGKPSGLLTYLVLIDRPVSRDDLARILWPDADARRAKHSLRQALSAVRQGTGLSLQGDPLTLGSEVAVEWELGPPNDGVDLGEILRLPVELRGIAGREWDRWVDELEQEIRSRASALLESRIAACLDEDQPRQAVRLAEAVVTLRPERAASWKRLAELHVWSGSPSEATDVLRRAEAHFQEPPADLVDMRRRLEAHLVSGGERETDPLRLPLVGREGVLNRIRGRAGQVRAGTGQAAALVAPLGLGKTRILEEVRGLLEAGGWSAARARGSHAEEGLRYGVVAQIVRELLRRRGAAGVSSASDILLHSVAPSRSSGPPLEQIEPVSLAGALLDLIGNVAYESPLLITIDDLQWADSESLAVIANVLHGIGEHPVFFLLSTVLGPGNGGEVPGASRLPSSVERIELTPLTALDTQTVLERAGAAREILGELAARVHEFSAGNPLYMVEFLESVRAGETLHGDLGEALSDASVVRDVPATARQLVQKRLARLDAASRAVLRTLLDGPSEPSSLRSRLRSTENLDDRIGHLLETGLLQWDAEGRLDFKHELVRQKLSEERREHRRQRSKRAYAAGAIAGLVVLTGAATGVALLGPPPPPFGGGTIVLLGGTDLRLMDVTNGEPQGWTVREPGFRTPDAPELNYVSPDGAGGLDFWGFQTASDGANVARLFADGRDPLVLVDGPGDDTWVAASPDGRHFLYTTENLQTEHYDHHLYRMEADGGNPVRVRGGESWLGPSGWSADGRRIFYTAVGGTDTVYVADPSGQVLAQRPFGRVHAAVWCAQTILLVVDGHQAPALAQWAPERSAVDTLATTVAPRAPACSPDGTASVFRGIRRGAEVLVLLDHATGEEHELSVNGQPKVYWLPEHAAVVPVGVEITGAPAALPWGDRSPVEARVRVTGGGLREMSDLQWMSGNPAVASVAGGMVFGNGPGSTRLVAVLDGWLADTIEVEVTGEPTVEPLLQDRFRSWPSDQWIAFGEPRPRSAGDALDMRGDGAFADGIITSESFDLETGLTAELEFRLPFTRRDRQEIRVEIVRARLLPGHDGDEFNEWTTLAEMGMRYPAGELEKFDPAVAAFGYQRIPVPAIADAPDTAWHHLALQVRADGYAELYINRAFAARSIRRIDTSGGPDWRVRILGRAADTRLLIRNFLLWPKTRYLADPEDDNREVPREKGAGAGPELPAAHP